MKTKARVIAFYLPQFHPIPENDQWWGKGFTEWTNVARAKALFRGHNQPRIPADLGFYDLRLPEVREQQAQMAREAGIEGFCYWHYWFDHEHQLLQRPFNEVLASGKPDYPFCLGWANHSWTNKSWEAGTRRTKEQTLMQMVYTEEEYRLHFADVLPAFQDKRYITVDGKPLFFIWRPSDIPNCQAFIDLWQQLARENGLQGIHFVGLDFSLREEQRSVKSLFSKQCSMASTNYAQSLALGLDAINTRGQFLAEQHCRSLWELIRRAISIRLFKHFPVSCCDQAKINQYLYTPEDKEENIYPTLMPNWDRSPRSGAKARIYTNSTPAVFERQLQQALDLVKDKKDEHKIIFLMSWNEWAEGNYIEPDMQYGHGYLDVLKKHLV